MNEDIEQVIADGTKLPIRQILTHRTGVDRMFGIHNGIGKSLRLVFRQAKHIKGKALSSFAANTGQSCELIR